MSTIASPSPPATGEKRIVIRGVTYEAYHRLCESMAEGQHVRLAYDGVDLEIMTTGPIHEVYKELIARLIAVVCKVAGIARIPLGQTTWKREELGRGIEADQCYYFAAAKLASARQALARRSNDGADYPDPDLAVEIDISRPEIDRMGIYAAMHVAEVWTFDGDMVVIVQLQDDGTYAPAPRSRFLPVRAEDLRRWLVEEYAGDDAAWELRLEDWARGWRGPGG